LRRGGGLPAADADRVDLRDEFRGDAGAGVALWLSGGAPRDAGLGGRAAVLFQAEGMALSGSVDRRGGGGLCVGLGPSGAGKETLIAGAARARPDLVWARRAVTRPEAAGAEPFESLTVSEFHRRRAAGEFALFWAAHGRLYG